VRPKRSWQAGSERSTPKGTLLEGHYKETYWSSQLVLKEASEACAFEDKLSYLLASLSEHAEFISTLRAGGGRAELFIGLFGSQNFGFELSPRIAQALAEIGLALSFDIYPDTR
jgi:hypothetical protein